MTLKINFIMKYPILTAAVLSLSISATVCGQNAKEQATEKAAPADQLLQTHEQILASYTAAHNALIEKLDAINNGTDAKKYMDVDGANFNAKLKNFLKSAQAIPAPTKEQIDAFQAARGGIGEKYGKAAYRLAMKVRQSAAGLKEGEAELMVGAATRHNPSSFEIENALNAIYTGKE